MAVTPEQAEKLLGYIKANHKECPFCGSPDLSASDYDGERTLSCKIECDDCDAMWYEYYKFEHADGFKEGLFPPP